MTPVACVLEANAWLSGVTTWALRLAERSRVPPVTHPVTVLLLVTDQPQARRFAEDRLAELGAAANWVEPVIRPAEGPPVAMAASLIEPIQRLGAAVILPNYVEGAFLAGTAFAEDGVVTIPVAHSDDPHYERLLERHWFAGPLIAGVSRYLARSEGNGAVDPPRRYAGYGVPIDSEPRPDRSRGPLKLLYSGRLEQRQKRVLDLVGLFADLRARGVSFEAELVGDGAERGNLERELAERGLTDVVRLTGAAPPARMAKHYRRADALLLPSEFEGTSLALLEAMGAGCVPVVRRTRSGAEDVITDGVNGRLADDVAGMTEAIVDLAGDRRRLALMAEAARERIATSFSLEAMWHAWRDLFDAARSSTFTESVDSPGRRTRLAVGRSIRESLARGDRLGSADFARERFLAAAEEVALRRGTSTVIPNSPEAVSPRIALYGAGQHTARLTETLARSPAPSSPSSMMIRLVMASGSAVSRSSDRGNFARPASTRSSFQRTPTNGLFRRSWPTHA
jgi:glycosyltransferase involved in cell wall biosynthesis